MSSFCWFILANKIANSALVLGVCWYIVRRYVHPFIKRTMDERLALAIELENCARLQKQENQLLVDSIIHYEQRAAHLLDKMHTWNQQLEKKKVFEQQNAAAQEKRTLTYLQRRADGLCQEHLRHAAFSRIYTQTREQVVAHFENKKVHQDYLDAIIGHLPKGDCRG